MALRSHENWDPTVCPQPGSPSSAGAGSFPSLLTPDECEVRGVVERDRDRSFARDLNLDQIVAAVGEGTHAVFAPARGCAILVLVRWQRSVSRRRASAPASRARNCLMASIR